MLVIGRSTEKIVSVKVCKKIVVVLAVWTIRTMWGHLEG